MMKAPRRIAAHLVPEDLKRAARRKGAGKEESNGTRRSFSEDQWKGYLGGPGGWAGDFREKIEC